MAGRPRKDISETWYDLFYAMPLVEQEIALRILQEHHRVESRRKQPKVEAKAEAKPATESAGAT